MLVVADEVGRVAQSLGCLVDDAVVVEIHPQPQGQLLAQHLASAAILARDGDDERPVVGPALLAPFLHGQLAPLGLGDEEEVEPGNMGSEDAHHEADVEHADQRARAHHLPVPIAEERGHEDDGDGHQGRVGTHLHLAEVFPHTLRDGQRQTLASQHQRVAAHLAGDAEGQQRAANQEFGKLQGPAERMVEGGGNLQETRQPHRQVGVEAEEEGDEDLRELAQLIVSAQQQNLGEDEDDVHADHDLAHRHRHAGDEREHVGWGGDGRGAQVGADGQRGAKGYDKQYEDEAHVAADPLRLASFPLFHDE